MSRFRHKNALYKHLFLIQAATVFIIAVFFLFLIKVPRPPAAIYHGPDPNVIRTQTLQPEITPTSETLTPIPSAVPAPTSKQTTEYGIAAGGILVGQSQDYLNKYFTHLSSLGVTWVRWDIDWSIVQSDDPSSYDWSGVDRVAATAKRYGINSLAIITYTARFARNKDCVNSGSSCQPDQAQTFGVFAGKVASRYKALISHFEIWNEPNSKLFWGPRPDTAVYAENLKEAYLQIKNANPGAFVLSGGLSASDDIADTSFSPVTFIEELYSHQYNRYFDGVALHPYTYPATPNYVSAWNNWQRIKSVRQLMIKGGDSAKKIWITEYGAPTGGPGNPFSFNRLDNFHYGRDYVDEAAQVEFLNEATTYYKKNSGWLGPFFWYSLRDNGTNRDTPENFFGLLRFDESEKPAFGVFQNIISGSK